MKTRVAVVGPVSALTMISMFVHAPAHAQAQADTTLPAEVGDIIVTAQKREQNVQKVPATVTVIDDSALQARGVSDLRGMMAFAPMTNFIQENVVTQTFIRAIGQTSDAETNDPGVAININGVYAPRYTLSASMFDIERVEVLAGPQGTLYGRNATGGATNVTTKLPADELGFEGMVELGNYDLVHSFAAIDVPLAQDVALRAAVDYNNRDGYMSNGQNASDALASRLTLYARPSDALSIKVFGELHRTRGNGDAIVLVPFIDPDDPWHQPDVPGEDFFVKRDVYQVTAEIALDLGGPMDMSLTYLPGYVYYDLQYRTPIGQPVRYYPNPGVVGTPLTGFAGALQNYGDTGRQFTNELRLSGSNNWLQWVLGLYSFRHHADGPGTSFQIYNPGSFAGGPFQPYAFQTGAGASYLDTIAKSQAVFGQATFSVSDSFRLTAGGRFSHDSRTAEGISQSAVPIAGILLPPVAYDLSQKDNRFDWKVGFEADVGADSMVYGSVQTGYTAGGFNVVGQAAGIAQFDPMTVLAYTLGIKNSFLDRRMRLNIETFYYDYKNLQVSAFNILLGGTAQYNVPKSEIYGAQVDLNFRPVPDTAISANIGYLHAEIVKGVLPPPTVYSCANPGAIPPELCSGASMIDYAGSKLPNAPKLSMSGSVTQSVHLGDGARIDGQAGVIYESSSWGQFANIEGMKKPKYAKVDASLTYHTPDERFSVGLWVKNLTNKAHVVAPATTSVYGLNAYFIDPPRTYGLRLGFDF